MAWRRFPPPKPRSYIEGTAIGLDADLEELEKKFNINLKLQEKRLKAEEYVWFFHGPPKIGKTTLCSMMYNPITKKFPYFYRFEEGTKGLRTYGQSVIGWEDFKIYIRQMWKLKKEKRNDFPFNYFIFDTVDLMFKQCHAYISKKNRITHASDLEYGKGWEFLVDEFARVFNLLTKFGVGLIFTSHSKETEFKTRTLSVTKWQPTLTGTGRRLVLPAVDIIGFCSYDVLEDISDAEKFKAKRVIRFEPSEEWEAGDRSGFLPMKTRLNPLSLLRHFPGNKKVVQELEKDSDYMKLIGGLR